MTFYLELENVNSDTPNCVNCGMNALARLPNPTIQGSTLRAALMKFLHREKGVVYEIYKLVRFMVLISNADILSIITIHTQI